MLATDGRTIIAELLTRQPGVPVRGGDGILRHVLRDRVNGGVDHLAVTPGPVQVDIANAAPAGAESKQRSGFEQWWQEATGDGLF